MTGNDECGIPQNYIVAMIDILGQKEKLKEHQFLTETEEGQALLRTPEGRRRFEVASQETYGRVLDLQENFKKQQEIYYRSISENKGIQCLSKEDRLAVEDIVTSVSFKFFSDTIVIYAPLTSENELKTRFNIASILNACAQLMYYNFAQGIFFRGGIDIGIGIEFPNNNGVYGLVLNKAYNLESNIAQYPRLVVGGQLRKLIRSKERKTKYSEFCEGLNNRLDGFSNSIIAKDKDGEYIIDFLGKGLADIALNFDVPRSQKYVMDAVLEIAKQYNMFLNQGNTKLCGRYTLLKEYYFSKLEYWGLESKEINL